MAIYLVRSQGYYKIGFSNDPYKRIAELQVGNPCPLELIGTITGTFMDEQKLHELFKSKQVRGEWFALSDEDVQVILSSSRPVVSSYEKSRKKRVIPPPDGENPWLDKETFLWKELRRLKRKYHVPN